MASSGQSHAHGYEIRHKQGKDALSCTIEIDISLPYADKFVSSLLTI